MSRSRKKTSISGLTTAETEKLEKRTANRRLRRLTRSKISSENGESLLPVLREVSNPWLWPKDGKTHFSAQKYPAQMRK